MDKEFRIARDKTPDAPMVQVGPLLPEMQKQLSVPARMERRVFYGEDAPALGLALSFSGQRLEVTEIHAVATISFITTQFLTQLSLPKVIRQISVDAIPESSNWTTKVRPDVKGVESYDFLAQLYWFEYLTWGSPRNSIMNYMGWSRANTNWHIRKISKEFPLPGPHSKEREGAGDSRTTGLAGSLSPWRAQAWHSGRNAPQCRGGVAVGSERVPSHQSETRSDRDGC